MDYLTLITTRSVRLAGSVPISLWCLLNNDAEAYRQVHAHLLQAVPNPSDPSSSVHDTPSTAYHQYQTDRLSPCIVRQAEEKAWAEVCKGRDVIRALGDWFGATTGNETLSEEMFVKIAMASGVDVVEERPDEPRDETRLIFS